MWFAHDIEGSLSTGHCVNGGQVFEQGKCPQKKKNVVAEALYAECVPVDPV